MGKYNHSKRGMELGENVEKKKKTKRNERKREHMQIMINDDKLILSLLVISELYRIRISNSMSKANF